MIPLWKRLLLIVLDGVEKGRQQTPRLTVPFFFSNLQTTHLVFEQKENQTKQHSKKSEMSDSKLPLGVESSIFYFLNYSSKT